MNPKLERYDADKQKYLWSCLCNHKDHTTTTSVEKRALMDDSKGRYHKTNSISQMNNKSNISRLCDAHEQQEAETSRHEMRINLKHIKLVFEN
jgi:hypothetical protein